MAVKKEGRIENLTNENLQHLLVAKARDITSLQNQIMALNSEFELKLNEKEDVIKGLKKEVDTIKKSKVASMGLTELDDKKKFILGLRSKLWQKSRIIKHASDTGIEGITEDLIDITFNELYSSSLSPEITKFFNDQSDLFKESLKTNGEEIKKRVEMGIMDNIDVCDIMIKRCMDSDDEQSLIRWIGERNNNLKTLNSLLGNVIDESKDNNTVVNLDIQNMQNALKDRSDNIIRGNFGNVKVV